MNKLEKLAGSLGIKTEGASPDELTDAISAKCNELKQHVIDSNKRSAEMLIKFAMEEGKLTPETAESFLSFAQTDYEKCKTFLEKAPVISGPMDAEAQNAPSPVNRYELLKEGIDLNELEYEDILKDPFKYGSVLSENEISFVRQKSEYYGKE